MYVTKWKEIIPRYLKYMQGGEISRGYGSFFDGTFSLELRHDLNRYVFSSSEEMGFPESSHARIEVTLNGETYWDPTQDDSADLIVSRFGEIKKTKMKWNGKKEAREIRIHLDASKRLDSICEVIYQRIKDEHREGPYKQIDYDWWHIAHLIGEYMQLKADILIVRSYRVMTRQMSRQARLIQTQRMHPLHSYAHLSHTHMPIPAQLNGAGNGHSDMLIDRGTLKTQSCPDFNEKEEVVRHYCDVVLRLKSVILVKTKSLHKVK